MVETPSVSLYTTLHVSPKNGSKWQVWNAAHLPGLIGQVQGRIEKTPPSGEYAMHPLQRELRIKKAGIQVRGLWPF